MTSWLERCLISAIQKRVAPAHVRVMLERDQAAEPPSFGKTPVIRIRDRGALFSLLLHPQIRFGDLYSEGRIEIDGHLVRTLESLYQLPESRMARLVSRWLTWTQPNTLPGSRRNIHHHYDLSNDFYRLWLDSQMLYTCAYFPDRAASLEEAQTAKLDHVCRKMWLRPDESVVEAGCGWGSFALHMARHYGVRVRAFNISREQIEYARHRARQEGLESRVEFIEDDYRNISGHYDVFASIGMLEHVGRDHLLEFGRVIRRSIGNSGRGLLHFIGRNYPRPLSAWIRKRIFPGGYPPSLREALEIFEPLDFSVLDVENIRMHYARTLECWLTRFEQAYDVVAQQFSPSFARMWRLYLAGSIAAFRVGGMQLFQVVFAGRQCQSQPWTRAYLYEGAGAEGQETECVRAIS